MLFKSENIKIINNIISNNSSAGLKNDAMYPTVLYTADYNDVYNNSPDYSGVIAGTHDLSLSPDFTASGDIKAYYHLLQTSPVRHTGSSLWAPLFDIDDEVRLEPVSMGADERDITYSLFLPSICK